VGVVAEGVEVVCEASWEVVAELVERFCETSRRGRGGGAAEGSARVPARPPRVVPEALEGWAETPQSSRDGGCRGTARGVYRSLRKGVVAELAVGPREASSSGRRGSRGHLSSACDEQHQGLPGGAFERPSWACPRGVLGTPNEVVAAAVERSARGLQNVVSSGPQASDRRGCQRAVLDLGKSWFGPARRCAGGRLATLCDSRLRHAVRPVD
jgi:hypothetical protein